MIAPASFGFPRFHLVLMVNHACNLACSYCYTGKKLQKPMPFDVGCRAIERAIHSLSPSGRLDLGFFGGEPLIEAGRISDWMEYAQKCADEKGMEISFGLTTNGTIRSDRAWNLLLDPALDVAISHDGLPEIHDFHRKDLNGNSTSSSVEKTLRDLKEAGKDFRVVMVIRPDSVSWMTKGVLYLHRIGVHAIDLSLDVWADWDPESILSLESSLRECADVWRENLRTLRINWFDEKLARLLPEKTSTSTRCGFGNGEISVAPSGGLYPCERLIGEDRETNPMRLPGHVMEGVDFLFGTDRHDSSHEGCSSCLIQECCNTTCKCNNYIRTGNPKIPDRLLCILNKTCLEEVARTLLYKSQSPEVIAC